MHPPSCAPLGSLALVASLVAAPGCDSDDDAKAPTTRANDHGIDPAVWSEIAWLPSDVDELGRLSGRMPVVAWLRSLRLDENEDCKRALDAITHYYMVGRPGGGPDPSPTMMFAGAPAQDDVAGCADAFSDRLGFTAARTDDGITLTQAPPEGVEVEGGPGVLALRWVEREGATFVLVDAPDRVDALQQAAAKGGLDDAAAAPLRALVAQTRTGEDAAPWLVGTEDVSAFWLQTPGLGYVVTLMQTPDRMVVMGDLPFADRTGAERAEGNVESLYADAKFLEPSFSGYAELPPSPATALRFRAEVPLELADLARLREAMKKVRQVRALGAGQASPAPPAPAPPPAD